MWILTKKMHQIFYRLGEQASILHVCQVFQSILPSVYWLYHPERSCSPPYYLEDLKPHHLLLYNSKFSNLILITLALN